MRQTGRTSRIVDFAVNQLFSVGQVIITDHVAFEYPNTTRERISYFIDKVKDGFALASRGSMSCSADVISVKGTYVVHFVSKRISNN